MSLKKFLSYLKGKRSEVRDMDLKDLVMAKAILDIHRKRIRKQRVFVPLFSLYPIHILDRENAVQATRKRVEMLREHKTELLSWKRLGCEDLARYLPSISWIKVVQAETKLYLAFEGNGRLAALQQVFAETDAIEVEVEEYLFRSTAKIVRRLNRVRRMNGLIT